MRHTFTTRAAAAAFTWDLPVGTCFRLIRDGELFVVVIL